MRQLVEKGAIDLSWMLNEPWIQRNHSEAIVSVPSSCFETRIPFNSKLVCDSMRAE
jgi:hypothetical protein